MTLRMGDGLPSNLPQGLDAYAGYVDMSGIGITYPGIVAKFPNAEHLSISVKGNPAMCADVEAGAMSDWTGYLYGYCEVSLVNPLIKKYGRPPKLWTAHYGIGAHICSPQCWPGLVTTADGTQWTTHGNDWDESLLADDFFEPTPAPSSKIGESMIAATPSGAGYYVARPDGSVYAYGDAVYKGGINNAGPNGTSAMVSGDSCSGIAVHPQGGYWLSTVQGRVYAFGGAPFYGGA